MSLQIGLWELAGAFIGMAVFFLTAMAGGLKLFFALYEQRMTEKLGHLSSQMDSGASEIQRLEREFLKFQADMPLHYVRREDYIRGQSVIESKLDALFNEVKQVQIKGAKQ